MAVKTGAVVSRKEIVWTWVATLPQPSWAVKVRSMTRLPSHGKLSLSAKVTVTPEQASVAVAISVS